MRENNISLSSRIFYYMMVFIVVESIMIAGVTLYQFNNQNSEYHEGRLERKENNLLTDIKYEIDKSGINSIDELSNSMILEVADVHNLEFELYSLEGILLKSSTAVTGVRGTTIIDQQIVDYFKNENPSRYVEDDTNTNYFKSSYNLVANFKNEPLGIIYIPYFLSASIIARTPEAYGFKIPKNVKPFKFETIKLEKSSDIAVLASVAGVKPNILRDYNPELRQSATPAEGGYELKLPVGIKKNFAIFDEKISQFF